VKMIGKAWTLAAALAAGAQARCVPVQPRLHPWSQASGAVATRARTELPAAAHRVEHSRVGTQRTAPAGPRRTTTHKWRG
jgi:hypothetical protein